jgi:hypothetical protein
MNYKVNDIVTINGIDDYQFRVVMFSEKSLNLMLVKIETNQLWSAHVDDVTLVGESQ